MVSDSFKGKEIQSLRQSIDINERFKFISELFNNETEVYDNAIKRLDDMESFQDGIQFVSGHLASKYNWNMEKDTEKQFMKLVKRKFGRGAVE